MAAAKLSTRYAKEVRDAPRCHPTDGGEVRAMTYAQGYVMARRPGSIPFVVPESMWFSWPVWPSN